MNSVENNAAKLHYAVSLVYGAVLHARFDPFKEKSEDLALEKAHGKLFFGVFELCFRKYRFEICLDKIFAKLHDRVLVDVAVHRVIYVADRALVFGGGVENSLDVFVKAVYGREACDYVIHLLLDYLAYKGGDVLKMVVKRVAVDAAVLDDIANADLA